MTNAKGGSVPAYIGKFPAGTRKVLERVRRLIRGVLPGAEETIGYGIPAYRMDGRAVVYFAGWKRHWSLYPVTPDVRAAIGSRLDALEIRKGTVRFPLDEPIPAPLVERIVRELAKKAGSRTRGKAPATRSHRPAGAAKRTG